MDTPYNYIHSVQSYRFGKNRGILGTYFRGRFQNLVCCFWAVWNSPTIDCWHKNQGMEQAIHSYRFGMENEAEFGGTVLVL
jgi:hypothetical protein